MSNKTPFAHFKESLIAAALFSESTSSVEADPLANEIWNGYQETLRKLLPHTLRFRRLVVRSSEVIVDAEAGEFILDESSGGLGSIMELSWQIYLQSRGCDRLTVLFDEPENHLHPSLQRRIMPSLVDAFPDVQFIVATHSPFVVTSTPDSAVYVLDYVAPGEVESRLLDQANKAASADETLRDVLGLDSTMPLWAESRFDDILRHFVHEAITPESLAAMRRALIDAGLGSEFPDAIVAAVRKTRAIGDE
jgi:hypothetical protein